MKGKRHRVLAKLVDEGIADTLILGPLDHTCPEYLQAQKLREY